MKQSAFPPEFERCVLAALIQDTKFLRESIPLLRPEYFVDQMHATAVKVIVTSYVRTKTSPSKVGLLSGLVEELKIALKPKKDQESALILGPCREFCEEVFKPTGDVADVKDKFLDFARQREMENSVLETFQKLDSGELKATEALDAIRRTHQRINATHQGGSDYFPEVEGLASDFINVKRRAFSTGFRTLDMKMGGGMEAQTLTTFIAPPKGGKSMSLVNIGHANCLRGCNVFVFTLEIREIKWKQRITSRITGIPMGELVQQKDVMLEKVVKFWELYHPRLIIKEYPTKGAGCDDFRSYLYWAEAEMGIKPDVILIDYGDLLKSGGKFSEERHAIASSYEQMRALAQEFDAAVVTASQGNRESMTKRVVRMNDIAEEIRKCAISDHIVSVCRTDEEDREGKARLYFAGSRDAEWGCEIPIRFNWPTCLMAETVTGTPHGF